MPYNIPELLQQLNSAEARNSRRKRRKLVTKLGLARDPEACEALETVLRTDSDAFTRALAAKGLGSQESDSARGTLLASANDESPRVRTQVVQALREHRSADTYSGLAEILAKDSEETVRFTAASSLVHLGGDPAREALLKGLDHESAATRRWVIFSIGDLGDTAAVPHLEKRRLEEKRFNQAAIDEALKKLREGHN